jgi:hypothetical protein
MCFRFRMASSVPCVVRACVCVCVFVCDYRIAYALVIACVMTCCVVCSLSLRIACCVASLRVALCLRVALRIALRVRWSMLDNPNPYPCACDLSTTSPLACMHACGPALCVCYGCANGCRCACEIGADAVQKRGWSVSPASLRSSPHSGGELKIKFSWPPFFI